MLYTDDSFAPPQFLLRPILQMRTPRFRELKENAREQVRCGSPWIKCLFSFIHATLPLPRLHHVKLKKHPGNLNAATERALTSGQRTTPPGLAWPPGAVWLCQYGRNEDSRDISGTFYGQALFWAFHVPCLLVSNWVGHPPLHSLYRWQNWDALWSGSWAPTTKCLDFLWPSCQTDSIEDSIIQTHLNKLH